VRTAGGELLVSDAHGIRPPLQWLREDPSLLRGAEVSDKVVGKAAALLFCYGGVRSIWAETMSEAAAEFLGAAGVAYQYDILVPAILNREGTGLCPMEQKALAVDDPAQAFRIFDALIG
jgi:hypothetical protein